MTPEECVDLYCTAWNEPDAARRDRLLDQVWAEGATYTDPTVHAVGREELSAHIAGVLRRSPGSQVLRCSALDLHHGWARFLWKRVSTGGAVRAEGLDLAGLAEDGRIRCVVGFFGPLRSREDA